MSSRAEGMDHEGPITSWPWREADDWPAAPNTVTVDGLRRTLATVAEHGRALVLVPLELEEAARATVDGMPVDLYASASMPGARVVVIDPRSRPFAGL